MLGEAEGREREEGRDGTWRTAGSGPGTCRETLIECLFLRVGSSISVHVAFQGVCVYVWCARVCVRAFACVCLC